MAARSDARDQPLVSIVTPVYNGEPYLAECIESVLTQTYENWDYTIVDNKSTDGSFGIANSYAERDPRIRVEKCAEFLDQVGNLNRTISCISPNSDYAKLVMADDWIFPRCLEEMVAVAEKFPSVGIVSAYRLDDRLVTCDGLAYPSTYVTGREICRASLINGLFVFGSPTTLLFRSDLVRKRIPFYDESLLHEDTEACYEILRDHDFGFVHQVLTFTRRQDGSITTLHRANDPHHLLDTLIVTVHHGRSFLNPAEYAACLGHVEDRYYRFLADRSLSRPGRAFWEYHRSGLASANCTLSIKKLRRAQGSSLLHALAHPRRLLTLATTATVRPAEALPAKPGGYEDDHGETLRASTDRPLEPR